jgi:hypothetical protein
MSEDDKDERFYRDTEAIASPKLDDWQIASVNLPIIGNFVEEQHLHPIPLRQTGSGELAQMFGDVWEWTQNSYSPYPGYATAKGAIGEYNGKFMCNQLRAPWRFVRDLSDPYSADVSKFLRAG